jgi:tetratricopeptide (TPR) repeat protein
MWLSQTRERVAKAEAATKKPLRTIHNWSLITGQGTRASDRLKHEIIYHAVASRQHDALDQLERACCDQLRLNRPLNANALLDMVRELQPLLDTTFMVHLDLLQGRVLAAADKLDRARRCFERASALEPVPPALQSGSVFALRTQALLGIARLDFREGKFERAVERYQAILQTALPGAPYEIATLEYGVALARTGNHEEADVQLRRATEFPDLAPRAWLEIGRLRMHRGETEAAVAALRNGLVQLAAEGMSAIEADLRLELGLSLERLGQAEDALAALTSAVALYRKMADTIGVANGTAALARVRRSQNELAEAARLADEAASTFTLAQAPVHAGVAHMAAGEIYRQARARNEARRSLQAASELFENSGAADLAQVVARELRTLNATRRIIAWLLGTVGMSGAVIATIVKLHVEELYAFIAAAGLIVYWVASGVSAGLHLLSAVFAEIAAYIYLPVISALAVTALFAIAIEHARRRRRPLLRREGRKVMDNGNAQDQDKEKERKKRAEFLNREAAEVYLLLDYLSGRPDRSLGVPSQDSPSAGQQNTTQQPESVDADLRDPTRPVKRAMKIKYPLKEDSMDFESDAAFIVLARDMLNRRDEARSRF